MLGQYLAVPSLETFNVFRFDGWFTDYFVVPIILLSQKKNTCRFNYSDFFKCTWLYLFCRRTNWPVKECWDNENNKRLFQIHFYTQRTTTASFYPVTWTCWIYSKAMQYLHRLCIVLPSKTNVVRSLRLWHRTAFILYLCIFKIICIVVVVFSILILWSCGSLICIYTFYFYTVLCISFSFQVSIFLMDCWNA